MNIDPNSSRPMLVVALKPSYNCNPLWHEFQKSKNRVQGCSSG